MKLTNLKLLPLYKVTLKYMPVAVLSLLAIFCHSASTVNFEVSVDTRSKVIALQTKKTYGLQNIGVYASNEFDGARLSGFSLKNDSTALVSIRPENTPIVNTNSFITKNMIGKTIMGRDMVVLDIQQTSSNKKKFVALLTRQNPPAVTGYYTFQFFLQTILKNSALANDFLDQYRVLAFPLMNPDGVYLGHWRHNAVGVAANRDWSKYHQSEVRSVLKYIQEVLKEDKMELFIGLDFHFTWNDVFYTNEKRGGTIMPESTDSWLLALEDNIEGYTVNEQVVITYEIGDVTPKGRIGGMGRISAIEMMKLIIEQRVC